MSKRKQKIKEPLDFNKCKDIFDKVIIMIQDIVPNKNLLIIEINEDTIQQKNKIQVGLRLNCKYKLFDGNQYQNYSFLSRILIYGNKYIHKITIDDVKDALQHLFVTQIKVVQLGQAEMNFILDNLIRLFSDKILLSVLDHLKPYFTGNALSRLRSIQLLYDLHD